MVKSYVHVFVVGGRLRQLRL